ncbi:MAG: hypothetical protein KDD66_13660 [Bdellovibrionales bacterium]|nr:hypothetical protein [Planctomycetales bacterium]MCB0346159.1 hypothetical protein [Bdellovibrionales bacterium]
MTEQNIALEVKGLYQASLTHYHSIVTESRRSVTPDDVLNLCQKTNNLLALCKRRLTDPDFKLSTVQLFKDFAGIYRALLDFTTQTLKVSANNAGQKSALETQRALIEETLAELAEVSWDEERIKRNRKALERGEGRSAREILETFPCK